MLFLDLKLFGEEQFFILRVAVLCKIIHPVSAQLSYVKNYADRSFAFLVVSYGAETATNFRFRSFDTLVIEGQGL